MGELRRFDLYVNVRSLAIPLAFHVLLGRGNSSVSAQILFASLIFSWGKDFNRSQAQ